jgi:hypothetical protein
VRSSVDLPAPFGPTRPTQLAARDARGHAAQRLRVRRTTWHAADATIGSRSSGDLPQEVREQARAVRRAERLRVELHAERRVRRGGAAPSRRRGVRARRDEPAGSAVAT